MSIRGFIRRKDKKHLGHQAEVRKKITDAFPGTEFVFMTGTELPMLRKHKYRIYLFGVIPWFREFRFPCWEASYQGEGFIAEFVLASGSNVLAIMVTLYGRCVTNADPMLNKLCEPEGWSFRFPG